MFRNLRRLISGNIYLILGVIFGLYASSLFSNVTQEGCEFLTTKSDVGPPERQILSSNNKGFISPPATTAKVTKKQKLIRPRYYSTELGIREKLFVGVFTSQEKINTQAIHINRTIGHLVDKIKFFMTAQYKLKSKFNLTGLVGFTDTRFRYRPFQVIKYVGDNFGQDYDYYFFANDFTFINAHNLMSSVKKISVSMDVYLGTRVVDGSYCNLDAGILLSNSVLKSLREHLDWCVINSISDSHSENIGRCVFHSIGLNCQDNVQGQAMNSLKIKHFDVGDHLVELSRKEDFTKAVTVYPILQKNDFYLLNAYFLKHKLKALKADTMELSQEFSDSWPPGQRTGAKPATRFDLPRQVYFNMTHVFFADDFTNVREHTEVELLDIKNILNEVASKVTYGNKTLKFNKLINGYKTFDLSKGMDYMLDLEFEDVTAGSSIVKRFEVSKPLGKVEFVPAPYVTENTRVTILLPIQETEIKQAAEFLSSYSAIMNDKKQKTVLMLVLLYQLNTPSKGTGDLFSEIKDLATKMSSRHKNEDSKIFWVSIRIPINETITLETHKSLNFAVVDLALKKIGLDYIVLVIDSFCTITGEFLNRVRMNTISNFQIFSAIPFRQYNPKVSQSWQLEVNKNSGHFDREEYRFLSFYGRDYVQARKKYQYVMPIIRVDNDIVNICDEAHRRLGNIFEMFVKFAKHLHSMRASEFTLKVKYHEEKDPEKCNLFEGNTWQIAKQLLTKREMISEL